jgi:hypothetical protein
MENNFEIFCGSKETMESIANRKCGAVALNPRTMRYQTIDKAAKYEVKPTPTKEPSCLFSLYSNLDLRAIAKEKQLIL